MSDATAVVLGGCRADWNLEMPFASKPCFVCLLVSLMCNNELTVNLLGTTLLDHVTAVVVTNGACIMQHPVFTPVGLHAVAVTGWPGKLCCWTAISGPMAGAGLVARAEHWWCIVASVVDGLVASSQPSLLACCPSLLACCPSLLACCPSLLWCCPANSLSSFIYNKQVRTSEHMHAWTWWVTSMDEESLRKKDVCMYYP